MKIWIITSGSETLTLFKFLSAYDHDYVVYYDFFHWPYGDKTFDQASVCVEKGIEYLKKQGVDYIIVPPIYELHYLAWSHPRLVNLKPSSAGKLEARLPVGQAWSPKILPLFKTYLLEHCFKYSLVGKLGLFWDFADVEKAQILIQNLEKQYTLGANQKTIKKFHSPFVYRVKETPLRKYYLINLSYSNILVNKIIKFDLRYFKDAMADTVIPLNYGYFHYQSTITKFLNFKKIRFHSLDKVEAVFTSFGLKESKKYSLQIAYTGNCEFLRREKRLMRLLQRGKNIGIEFKKL